jgi:hypothetical protein
VPERLLESGWLDRLVGDELARRDGAARARLPADVVHAAEATTDLAPAAKLLVARSLRRRRADAAPDAAATFLEEVRLHVGLVLDLSLVHGEAFDGSRRRAEIAAFLAAAVGEHELALTVYPPADRALVSGVLRAIEAALAAQLYPPGDPVQGLPLHPGRVAVQRRRLARVAMGHHRAGRLDPNALARHAQYAFRECVLLVETLAALLGADPALADASAVPVRQRQLARLNLPRAWFKEARRAVASPRSARAIAESAPPPVRPFLVEQLSLAVLRAHLRGDGVARFAEEFAAATGLDAAALAATQVEAAAQHGDHPVWFEVLEESGGPNAWEAMAEGWDLAADQIVERVTAALSDNVEAVVTEIRQTGELGALLAKAASGTALNAAERKKVRAQLVDLAKAVPALAIFAAPGGLLLLPLLAKLLPFNLMPSAWDRSRAAAASSATGAAKGDGEPPPPKKAAG